MARKVINTTHSANRYDILSQTPGNYDPDNYFLYELQQKVDAEWEYRPNRVNIEYENAWGQQTYSPIEVVIQSVKSERGKEIADDFRQVVFRDILDSRFKIGSRFRFAPHYNGKPPVSDTEQNVWLSINTDSVKMTSSMIIERCNGTLGSLWIDDQGVSHFHYEPVVQAAGLSGVNLFDNETAVSPQSQLTIIAQHNDYTRDYFINQRFIVGYDKVYRINAINKFYSNSTFDANDVGIMHLYLELTEKSEYDDFEHRIAYQDNQTIVMHQVPQDPASDYLINFVKPEVIPLSIGDTPVLFRPQAVTPDGQPVLDIPIEFSCSLENLSSSGNVNDYLNIETDGNDVILTRKRSYIRGNLSLCWRILPQYTPDQHEVVVTFTVGLR